MWFLARVLGSSGQTQPVPGFGGSISATGIIPTRKSTIEYFTPINESFTDYSVIKELLKADRSGESIRDMSITGRLALHMAIDRILPHDVIRLLLEAEQELNLDARASPLSLRPSELRGQ